MEVNYETVDCFYIRNWNAFGLTIQYGRSRVWYLDFGYHAHCHCDDTLLSKGAKLMEVYRTMQGTPEQCYDLLIESLLMDLATSTGHNLTEDEIHEGYQYQKQLRGRMGNSGSVTVTLLELKRPNTYSVRFESAQGINTLEYHLEPLDDSQFKLTYAESYHSIKKRKMLNFKLMERFYRKGSQKRINLLLDQIQTILNERSVKA